MKLVSKIFVAGLLLPVFYLQTSLINAAEEVSAASSTPVNEGSSAEGKWQGGAELGFVTTKGNTDTQSTNGKLTVEYLLDKWKHKFKAEALRSEDKGVVTADHFSTQFRSQYNFKKKEFMFGSIRYEEDAFSGFDSRMTEVIGYGYEVYNGITFKMDLEAGAGARQTKLNDGTRSNDAIVRLGTDMEWKISDTSSLKEALLIEHGEDNTYTESITELKVRINSALALKVSASIKDNSTVPVDKKHTDTTTAVTLVYDF